MSTAMQKPIQTPNWKLARCKDAVKSGADSNDWFPDTKEQRARARKVCNHCPLKADCREYAKAENLVGYWGGVLFGYRLPDEKIRDKCPAGHSYDLFFYGGEQDLRRCSTCFEMRRAGKSLRRHDPELKREAAHLREQGRSAAEIAKELAISEVTVVRWLGMGTPHKPVDRELIALLYRQGYTTRAIAKHVGVVERTVVRWRGERGGTAA